MHSYRTHVYDLYVAAVGKAASVAVAYGECLQHDPKSEEFSTVLAEFQALRNELERAFDTLDHVFPADVKWLGGARRHLGWSRYWIDKERHPRGWGSDPQTIIEHDLPAAMDAFNTWYETASQIDGDYTERLREFHSSAQINSAHREAWAIFKTQATLLFDLSDDLDGYKLVDRLFGDEQSAVSTLTAKERRGYRELMKGLYTLYRNPVSHNDSDPNPAVTDAVTTLIGTCLARITPPEELIPTDC